MGFFDMLRRKKSEESPTSTDQAQVSQPVDKKKIRELATILGKYREGKQNHDNRVTKNYDYYKMLQWEAMEEERKGKVKQQIQPRSGWLFNSIANKHADAMDNYPRPNILAREKSDEDEAKKLSAIIPVVLDQCEFEKTYDENNWHKPVGGTAVYGVFWNKDKHNGLGDIDIPRVNILNLFWQPGVEDIQKSRYVFHTALIDNDVLESTYPELKGKLGGRDFVTRERRREDHVDDTNMSTVVDVYYKVKVGSRTILHYIKYCGDTVLYSTENDNKPDSNGRVPAQSGLYDHGRYPFELDVQFPNSGSPAGFGFVDIGADTQNYIDRLSQAIMKNTMASAAPRFFSKKSAGINKAQYSDLTQEIIEYEGNLADAIVPIPSKGLDAAVIQAYHDKIEELKEVTGNRDVSTGGTTSGVTAASAIAAMQEASSKLSRDSATASYRHYRNIIYMVIELIRQFYDIPRSFRITGDDGSYRFVTYSNEKIVPQSQGDIGNNGEPSVFGVEVGYRVPQFDIEITAEKKNPYTRISQNELMLQLYQYRMFDPQNSDQALACLDGMDFDGKDKVIQKVGDNGTLLQMLVQAHQRELMMAQIIDRDHRTNLAQQLMQEMMPMQNQGAIPSKVDVDLSEGTGESSITQNARQRTAELVNPR